MARFYQKGENVVVRYNGKIILGAVEIVDTQTPDPVLHANIKVTKYSVRSESGKLLDWVQTDIDDNKGYIDSLLTEKYFKKNTIPKIAIVEQEDGPDCIEIERRVGLFQMPSDIQH